MSTTTISFQNKDEGVLRDVTSVAITSAGVTRDDTGAVVVAGSTPLVKQSTGTYAYTFTDPVAGLAYTYSLQWVYQGNTYTAEFHAEAAPANSLVSLADFKAFPGVNTTASDAVLQTHLDAASDAIRNHCENDFAAADHVEYFSGKDSWLPSTLTLAGCPINSITRVATKPVTSLYVSQPDAQIPVATVRMDDETVTLIRYVSGVATTQTVSLASCNTLSDLATAINALGNSWSATVTSGYESFPISLLRVPQGALSAKQTAKFVVYSQELSEYDINSSDSTGSLHGYFPAGTGNIEVRYNAGYVTIPQAVQTATCLVAKAILNLPDTNLDYEKLGDYSWSRRKANLSDPIFADATALLGKYRRIHW